MFSEYGLMELKVGDLAPDFELMGVVGTKRTQFKLSENRGKKNIVLAFYPVDWSPV